MTLIFQIAPVYDVPPYLVAAIIIKESNGNVSAVNYNKNGTIDRGLMQLNSSWCNIDDWEIPETNIREGIKHLHWLYEHTRYESPTWYSAVIAYNCGLTTYQKGPPKESVDYAIDVFNIWNKFVGDRN